MKRKILGALLCALTFVCLGFGADGIIVLQQSGTQQGVQSSKYTVLNCTLGMSCTSTGGKFVLTSAAGAVTWRGAWGAGTAYSAGDAVGQAGVAYVAIASSTGVTPGTDSTKWVQIGATGPTGSTGATGATGAAGANGTNGTAVLNGSGAPSGGSNGDFWIDTAAHCLYGPKAAGSWPGACTSLIGTLSSASAITLTGTAAGEVDFGEALANGSNYTGVKGADSISTDTIFELPSAPAAVGFFQVGARSGSPLTSVVTIVTALPSGFTATTQSAKDNSTKVATTAYVDRPVDLPAAGTSVSLTAPAEMYVCSSTCTVTPPVPAAGYQFCVFNGDNVTTVITLAALGSSARYENQARTAYGTAGTGTLVMGGAAKDQVCLIGLDATHYLTVSVNGSATVN